jgi:autotransporter-associated beta strand protein
MFKSEFSRWFNRICDDRINNRKTKDKQFGRMDKAVRATLEPLENRVLLSWTGATSGDTNDAAHDYNNTANWSGGTIDDSFAGVTLAGDTTLYFSANHTTGSSGLNLGYAGDYDLSLQSDSSTTRTLTLAGDVSGNYGGSGNSRSVVVGDSTNGLNLNLGGSSRTLTVGADDELTIANVVSNGSLVQSGGTLTLADNNTYTGATIVTDGATMNVSGSLGDSLVLVANGTLSLQSSGAVSHNTVSVWGNGHFIESADNALSGNAALSVSGTATLSHANNHTGGINISDGGTLNLDAAGALSAGTLFRFGGTINTTVDNAISGTASVQFSGTGTATIAHNNNYTGSTGVDGPTVNVTAAGGLGTGTWSMGTGTLNLGAANARTNGIIWMYGGTLNTTANGAISGTASLYIVNSSSVVTLSGSNSFTGGTNLSSGTLRLAHADALASSVLSIGGGTLELRSDVDTTFATAGIIVNATGLIDVDRLSSGSDKTLSLGAVTLAYDNAVLNVTGGHGYTLGLGPLNLIYGASKTINANGASVAVSSVTGSNHSLVLTGTTGANSVGPITTGAGRLTVTAGTWALTGTNTYTGETTISDGALQIGNGGTSGTLGTNDVINNATMIFDRSDDISVTNVIRGSGSIVQNGTGDVELLGLNTYTGSTTVNSGTITTPPDLFPGPWRSGAVGTSGGLASETSGVVSISSEGSLAHNIITYSYIGARSDSFDTGYQLLGDNEQFVAKVTSQDDTGTMAKAGIMFRASGNSGSAFVGIFATPGWGVVMLDRRTLGADAEDQGYDNSYRVADGPVWLKLTTDSGTVTGWASTDGSHWAKIGEVAIDLGSSPIACVAADSDNGSETSTATFEDVSLGAITSQTIVPQIPHTMAAEAYSGTDGRLVWHPQADADTYTIQQSSDGGTSFATVATVPGWADTYLPKGLSPNTTYIYRMFATGPDGDSPLSPPISLTTMAYATPGYYQLFNGEPYSLGHGGIDVVTANIGSAPILAESWEQAMFLDSTVTGTHDGGAPYEIGNFAATESDTGYYGDSFGFLIVHDPYIIFNDTAGELGAPPNQPDEAIPISWVNFSLKLEDPPHSPNILTQSDAGPGEYILNVTDEQVTNVTYDGPHFTSSPTFSWDVSGDSASPSSGTVGADQPTSVQLTALLGEDFLLGVTVVTPSGTTPSSSGPHATVNIHAVNGFLDVDSKNDSGFTPDPHTPGDAEDAIEDDAAKPGKYVAVNDDDSDGDGTPDFADGFTTVVGNVAKGGTVAGEQFVPISLKLTDNVDVNKALVRITYDASDPRDLTRSGAGTASDPYVYTPGAGTLRLWKRPGSSERSGEPVGPASGGDFIVSGGAYKLADLGFTGKSGTLYAEGINPGEVRITIELDPDGIPGTEVYSEVDAVRLTVVGLDADVDSDNDNQFDSPERNAAEDQLEARENDADNNLLPGKVVVVNDSDLDGDGILDYSDGFNADGVAGGDDATPPTAAQGEKFVPFVLDIPAPIDLTKARLQIDYDASVPGVGPGGSLRLWTVDGSTARSKDAFTTSGGHYVPKKAGSDFYSAAELGQLGIAGSTRSKTLYIEGIAASTVIGDKTITIRVDPDGDGPAGFLASDVVRLTTVRVDLDVDSDNTDAFGGPARSQPEDALENIAGDPARPGKFIVVNDDDGDNDGILDYSDGFNADGVAGGDDATPPTAAQGEKFVPLVIDIPAPIDLSKARLQVDYDASVPGAGVGGALRLWTVDGSTARSKDVFTTAGGHYVAKKTGADFYSSTDLGLLGIAGSTRNKTVFIEAIGASAAFGDKTITIRIDPDGDGPLGFVATDVVRLTSITTDLDVDSDNNNAFGTPDQNPYEDQIENLPKDSSGKDLPGKIVLVNDGDLDGDGILDYSDGFDADGVAVNADNAPPTAAQGQQFTPVVITVPAPIDLTKARLQVDYDASVPGAGSGGSLRLWTKDGSTTRSKNAFTTAGGGDYVPKKTGGDFYAPADLTTLGLTNSARIKTLYIEGIAPSAAAGDKTITVRIDPDGDGPADFITIDVVRLTTVRVDLDVNGNKSLNDASDGTVNYLPGYEGTTAKVSTGTTFNTAAYVGQQMKLMVEGLGSGTVLDSITFKIDDVTVLAGYTGNATDPKVTGAATDEDFSFEELLNARSAAGTMEAGKTTVPFWAKDYGGWAKIKVEAKVGVNTFTLHEFTVPNDSDGDKIADKYERDQLAEWKTQYGLGATFSLTDLTFFDSNSNKEEADPDGAGLLIAQKSDGDNLVASEEYRGMILDRGGFDGAGVNGHTGGYKRLGFARKEALVEVDLRNALTPPGGNTFDILDNGVKIWSNSSRGCGVWIYYLVDQTALNFGVADANVSTQAAAWDYLKSTRNATLKQKFLHLIVGEDSPAWLSAIGSGRGVTNNFDADLDKRGEYIFFNSAPIAPTAGGLSKTFAHEMMHLMYKVTTGNFNAGQHVIDPDGDGHFWDPSAGGGAGAWVGGAGPDVDDQSELMWQLSHADQEDMTKVWISAKVQEVLDLRNNLGVSP